MEKLGYSRDIHIHHDIRILHDDRWRSSCVNDNGKHELIVSSQSFQIKIFIADFGGSS